MCRSSKGMTLLELLIAISIMAMIVGVLGALANGVQQGYEYTEGYGTATQHARVASDRISRTVSEATANEQFPGFLVLAETQGTWRFPDTLVVWRPSGQATDPNGLPRYCELVIYCPNWYIPNQFMEITVPGDTRTVPPVTDLTTWAAEVLAIKKRATTQTVLLTDLLRTCAVSNSTLQWRGAVRFESRLLPSDSEWSQYKSGTLAWQDLNWVQGIYGNRTGLRQAWLRFELQLMPGATWSATNRAAQLAAPFFGSAAVYYEMRK